MIMSDKSGINLKVVSPLANLSADSEVILSGRCASTPKDSSQLSAIDLISDFDSIKENTQLYLNLNGVINFAPVPIFGRRNLQLLNNCVNKDPSLQSPEAVKSLLQNEKNIFTYLTEANVNDQCVDVRRQYSEESSASITHQIRQEIKRNKNKNKNLTNSKRNSEAFQAIPLKKVNYSTSKKKRLSHYKSKVSALKVCSRAPNAPRLLTAIRAEFKENRQRSHKGNDKVEKAHEFPIPDEKIRQQERITKDKNKLETITKSSKLSANLIDTKNSKSTPCAESHKNKETEKHKLSKLKKVKEDTKQEADDARKLTLFKARPIRKYVPLPTVKKRIITIPLSPKIGKRKASGARHCCFDA